MITYIADNQITIAIISGAFSMASTFGAILLKDYLDKRKQDTDKLKQRTKSKITDAQEDSIETKIKRSSNKRPFLVLFVSILIGLFGRIIDYAVNYFGFWISLLLVFIAVLFILKEQKRHLQQRKSFFIQIEILILWSGYIFAWSLFNNEFLSQMISLLVMCWLFSAIIAVLVLNIFNKSK